jgi:uncharacterized damage-inducible protein DinB
MASFASVKINQNVSLHQLVTVKNNFTMTTSDPREVWQRGPVEGVPALLQPVAHALLQAAEDAQKYTEGFPDEWLWEKPGGVASVGFHLLHIRGVIDRLFTYARGESLNETQLRELTAEKEIPSMPLRVPQLVDALQVQVEKAVAQLRRTHQENLTDARTLGRKKIPTNMLGLLFHAAEHCQRHVGQLLVTSRILRATITPHEH